MRRDLNELQDRLVTIYRHSNTIWRFLIVTDAPHAEEHYDLAHAAAKKAEEALAEVSSMLHEWAQENGVAINPQAKFTTWTADINPPPHNQNPDPASEDARNA